MLLNIRKRFMRFIRNRIWRYKNQHNFTKRCNDFSLDSVSVGKYTYGGINVVDGNIELSTKLRIGHYCSIASGVVFMLNDGHRTNTLSTYPFEVKCLNTKKYQATTKGDIVIEDDVWIGQQSIIMSGVRIHQGSIVAAGSVVTKDVPPYAIVGGVPARVIKYRFPERIVQRMANINWEAVDKELLMHHLSELSEAVDDGFDYSWLPQKA